MMSIAVFWGLLFTSTVFAAPSNQLFTDKVINGQDAANGTHLHQVTIQRTFSGLWYHTCGGSVIAVNFILTAAHCVDSAPPGDFRVVVNDHKLYEFEGPEQVIGVKRIYIHEDWIGTLDYDLKLYPNDIAVLMLDTEVLDKDAIITMATDPKEEFAGESCTISGWGLNDTNGIIPNTLQEVNMTVMSQTNCSDFWKQLWPNDTIDLFMGQICIFGGEDPVLGASACNGDSGGPMVCNGLLAGVTSWGVRGCRDEDTQEFRPSVYVRVSYYFPWIQTTMGRFEIGRG